MPEYPYRPARYLSEPASPPAHDPRDPRPDRELCGRAKPAPEKWDDMIDDPNEEIAEQADDPSVNDELVAALVGMVERYADLIDLINSGDCGFWNPEDEAPVKAARAALAKAHAARAEAPRP